MSFRIQSNPGRYFYLAGEGIEIELYRESPNVIGLSVPDGRKDQPLVNEEAEALLGGLADLLGFDVARRPGY